MILSNNLFNILIFAILVLGIAIYLMWLLYAGYVEQRIEKTGLIADGKVVNRSQKYIARKALRQSETHYFIHYAFGVGISGVDQKIFNGSQRVSETTYNKTGIGDPIEAIYLPRNPNMSRLASNRTRHRQTIKRKLG